MTNVYQEHLRSRSTDSERHANDTIQQSICNQRPLNTVDSSTMLSRYWQAAGVLTQTLRPSACVKQNKCSNKIKVCCNIQFILLTSHTVSVRAFCSSRRVCCLSVPCQISKTKQDRHEILSPFIGNWSCRARI